MRILEYNDFRSGSFPQKEDIQSCFYDITEDESICPPGIFKGKHANVTFVGGNFYKKRKLVEYKEQLASTNKYYHAKSIWEDFNKNSQKLDTVKNLNETNKFDYLIFYVGVGFKSLNYEPTFNRFKYILGNKDKFNQDYGKGEDVYTKAQRNFREYDDVKNKELFDIIDTLEGCVGRVQDLYPKWTPFNYLVGHRKDGKKEILHDIHYQGYYVFNVSKEEHPLWDIIFRNKIEMSKNPWGDKMNCEIIDGILD